MLYFSNFENVSFLEEKSRPKLEPKYIADSEVLDIFQHHTSVVEYQCKAADEMIDFEKMLFPDCFHTIEFLV